MNKRSNKKIVMTFTAFFCFVFVLNLTGAADFYVNPSESIQKTLDKAMPGDTIHLESGVYLQGFDSVRNGEINNPITIIGPSNAVIKGDGRGRVSQIFHDYHHLIGFTFDGLVGSSNNQYDYRDKLLYVQGTGNKEGVEGLKILNMTFKNSGGEAVRLRYFAQNNEIAYSKFENIGVYDFKFNGGGKNGEAIYVGTSSNQWNDGKNPTSDPDESNNNWIHHNYFNTQGNECVDIKEGSMHNLVENNICTGQKDSSSGGLDSRSDENIFRYNEVHGNSGVGIRLGGHNINGHQYGTNNYVYGNKIYDNGAGGIKIMTSPQKEICGNEFSDNVGGNLVGSYLLDFAETNCNPDSTQNSEDTNLPDTTIPTTEETLPGESNIIASSNDGNVAENLLDGNLDTRWSAQGYGEYVIYNLKKEVIIDSINIAFYRGDSRIQKFSIEISEDGKSWAEVYSGESSGKTNEMQNFDFEKVSVRYVKIIGYGNSVNNWNSLTEIKINESSEQTTQENFKIISSSDDGNVAENLLDGNLDTRWSAQGDGEYVIYNLEEEKEINQIQIAFYKGDSRIQYFKIQTSLDGTNWSDVFSGESSGETNELQTFGFEKTKTKYLKIVGLGNTKNYWNSLTEVVVN